MKEAMYYQKHDGLMVECLLCPHNCKILDGRIGRCGVRQNTGGVLYALNYGRITSISLDPIEKKPLYHFHPGSRILSAGSFGCNFSCRFCQNHEISMGEPESQFISPDVLVAQACELVDTHSNIGIAYTYNEPLIGYEYVLETAVKAAETGLYNVLVTNGFIMEEPLRELLPHIHAMNIDLKSAGEDFYHNLCGGRMAPVMRTIEIASDVCHVEVTALIIPDENDSPEDMKKISQWLSSVNPEIPLHINRFRPCYNMLDKSQTPKEKIYELTQIAQDSLRYVYQGNMG